MIAQQARELTVGGCGGVTFARGPRGWGERQVPKVSEQRAVASAPQPMRALPAHAGGPRRCGHAAGGGERRQKRHLPLSRPAVGANAMLGHRAGKA